MSRQTTVPNSESRWLTYAEAAAFLQCSERQLRRWVTERKIAHTRLGGLYTRFSREQLEEFVAASTVAAER